MSKRRITSVVAIVGAAIALIAVTTAGGARERAAVPRVVAHASAGAAPKGVMAYIGQDFVTTGELTAQRMIDRGQIKRGAHVFCPVEIPAAAYAVGRSSGVNNALKKVGAKCDVVGTGSNLGPAKT